MVTRIFVEKKKGYDVEATQMKSDLVKNLGIKSIEELRIINRYDVSGLSDEEMKIAGATIFSEPNVDNVYGEDYTFGSDYQVFAMEYLPGQYDQRADSASQCVQLLTQGERPVVTTARVVAIKGSVTEEEMDRVKSYLVNPVESRLASLEKPESLEMKADIPEDVKRVVGLTLWSKEEVANYYGTMGFAMTLSDLEFVRDYFRDEEKRDPSVTELRVIDTYWSDHCRHTTFLTKLESIEIEEGELSHVVENALNEYMETRAKLYKEDRDVNLMDMACIGGKFLSRTGVVTNLDVSDEINACSIEVPVTIDGKTEQWLVQFKNETHNHPTEIEPFGGAATCLGGAIRDPLSGRSYVYQAMRVTGSGDPTISFKDTLKGKLPSRKITTGAAAGYSSYGNQIGLATGQVTELYDPGYVAKRMEIGAVIGASPKSNVVREEPKCGDIIVLLGGATGRDGCGGATGSSKAHTLESIEVCGAEVQKGNPPTERKIQRLFRNPDVSTLIKRCNDFGAGGVCVAIGELAPGLTIDLNKVPKKYEGLDGTELAISESQERMAVVLDPKDVDAFIEEAHKENLDAKVVAIVTDNNRLTMDWRGDTVVSLSRAFLDTNGVTQKATAKITAVKAEDNYRNLVPTELKDMSVSEAFTKNLSRLNVCSQKGLSERFDASIGAGTVHMPFAGKYQLTPEDAMVAKIPLLKGTTDDATAMSFGYIPGISRFSPFYGAAYAVVESLSKLAVVGANPLESRLTFQEYFERLYTDPTRWGKPAAALLGALTVQLNMGLPAIGGKDSMSGSFEELDVPPTLVSFAVAMTKASKTLTAAFSKVGGKVILLPLPECSKTMLPKWEELKIYYKNILDCIESGKITAASVVKEGGVAAATAKMAMGNMLGVDLESLTMEELFAPKSGWIVVEGSEEILSTFENSKVIGTITDKDFFTVDGKEICKETLKDAFMGTLEKIFPNNTESTTVEADVVVCSEKYSKSPAIKIAKPKVFIPVFPGTNCEIDSARVFEKAGAEANIMVVQNLSVKDIENTIETMEKAIRESQIIMIPGGFSGGDEPEGSGKFIATTFRNPKIATAITDLLESRDGLVLGICNGFQALVKLGLVTYGKITEPKEEDPTLTFNTLGRHVSRMVYTKVTNTKSPWLSGVNAGDVFAVPVSHGEGRFVAQPKALETLIANGQIATQYTTPCGQVSGDVKWNPNGSVCGIEGITSPDGRVFGKMGHSERNGQDLYKNVPGLKDQLIFESGVKYFK